jgi:uncharacterized protein
MKVLVSGSSGTIGTSLVKSLKAEGDDVVRLVRRPASSPDEISWNPERGEIKGNLEDFDAFVNLAGAPIAEGRWSKERKNTLIDSRVQSTSLLSHTIDKLEHPPKTFISASATGIYGDQGDKVLTEKEPSGKGFLAKLASLWEGALNKVKNKDVRTISMRLGNVLSDKGGMLKALVPIFKTGTGSPLGSGKQYVSWVGESDVVDGIKFALHHKEISGPVNMTSPNPVTNKEFSQALGKALHRPVCPFPAPAPVIKLAMGEKGEELLLGSQRAVPEKLTNAGYHFHNANVQDAMNQYAK